MRDEELLAHFQEMRCKGEDTTRFNFFDFLHAYGSPLDALFYSRLFWPEFVEADGMIFLKESTEDVDDRTRINETLRTYGGDRTKAEQSFNLIEVPALFGKHSGDTTDEEDFALAERLAQMWRLRLEMVYPNRKVIVSVLSSAETGGEIGIVFYTERADRAK